jgi:hypothetical protein
MLIVENKLSVIMLGVFLLSDVAQTLLIVILILTLSSLKCTGASIK